MIQSQILIAKTESRIRHALGPAHAQTFCYIYLDQANKLIRRPDALECRRLFKKIFFDFSRSGLPKNGRPFPSRESVPGQLKKST